MAYIEVNHRNLQSIASEVDSYISRQKSMTQTITQTINGLSTSWQGDDYAQFKNSWLHSESSNSTLDNMIKSLDGYAEFLRYAAKKYIDAQEKAVNRANRLPRY